MINILIVDDNPNKVKEIRKVIKTVPEIKEEDVCIGGDLIKARDLCREHLFDLLILDIRLPNSEGDEPADMGGCEFVKELNASATLFKPYHIIGLTEYDEVFIQADPFFQEELWRVLRYKPGETGWKKQLVSKLQYLVKSKKALQGSSHDRYFYDIAIITALHTPELRSILNLDADWKGEQEANDSTNYYHGVFKNNDKELSVVAACAHQMGMCATTLLANKIITWFRPRYLVMTGIAAGVKGGDAKLGDILVANQSWDYESGKHKVLNGVHVFEPEPRSIPLQIDVREKFLHLIAKEEFLSQIEASWRKEKPSSPLQAHIGPLASGAGVIQDMAIVEGVKAHQRKLIGIDMETYGIFLAADTCVKPRPTAISIKAVCDFADEEKANTYQAYAAYASAQYFYQFALSCL